jgi:ABC-type lipoprotein release transport system permease subunit
MSVWRLVLREIAYRKLNFGLAVLSVLTAVGCLVAVLTLLRLHDLRTEDLVAAREAEVRASGGKLQDDYRKMMLLLRFNIRILPKDQNLADYYAADYAARTMPEEYAERLARAGVVTVNHILPSLRQRVTWDEHKRTIIVVGVRGELPIGKHVPKKPLLEMVPPGTMLVGHELHASLGIKKGAKVRLLGREFKVRKLNRATGTPDDITVWINLAEAQQLLDRKGRINEIQALECNCASPDRLGDVRKEVARILPETQVIEQESQALTRAEARNRAAAEARASVVRVQRARAELRSQREEFGAVLVPLVLLGCVVSVGVLALTNVRDRATEIGILRALGLGSGRLLGLFLGRALLLGLVGASLGYGAGVLVGMLWSEESASWLFDPVLLLLVVASAPLVCGLASWVPALLAARQDPAVVLREG